MKTAFSACWRPLVFCFLATVLLLPLQAQDGADTPQVGIIATGRFIDGKVELRWYPSNAGIWRFGCQAGYTVERMDLDVGTWQPITARAVRPYTPAQWAQLPPSPYTQAAARAIAEVPAPPAAGASFFDWEAHQNTETGVFLFFIAATNLDANASLGAGLRYEDADVVAGKRYAYRIRLEGWKGTETMENFVVVEDTRTPYTAPAVQDVHVEEREGAVRLQWPATNAATFPAFHVERSADGRRFERINRLPLLFTTPSETFFFTDSVANYTPHYYRVVGMTPFGDAGAATEPIRAMGRDRTPPLPATDVKATGSREAIRLTWEAHENASAISGYQIGRSANINGPFRIINERILPGAARQWTDDTPQVFEPFYVVNTLDTAQNVATSLVAMANVSDTEAPASPQGFGGTCDTAGVVRLQWLPNTEADVVGYHIHTANSPSDVFVPITARPVGLTAWTDTVNMTALNRAIYYKITAVDYNNNPSAYSQVLEVLRPDVVPPAAPLLHRFDVAAGQIRLEWHLSSSDDVRQYTLRRQSATADTVLLVFDGNQQRREWTDTRVQANTVYAYQLIAEDAAGHRTASEPLSVSAGAPVRSAPHDWQVQLDAAEHTAHLRWNGSTDGAHRYIVYRAQPGRPLTTYRSFAADTQSFADALHAAGTYRYALKMVWPDGSESPLSEVIAVEK